MGYKDDLSLQVPLSIEKTLTSFVGGVKRGLQLNIGKCEVISKAPLNPEGSLSGFSTLRPADAILLGASFIGPGSVTDHAFEARCSDLRIAIARLKTITAHDALILLRSFVSAPKLLHTL